MQGKREKLRRLRMREEKTATRSQAQASKMRAGHALIQLSIAGKENENLLKICKERTNEKRSEAELVPLVTAAVAFFERD